MVYRAGGGLNFWRIRMGYLRLPIATFLMKNYFINSPSFIPPNWSPETNFVLSGALKYCHRLTLIFYLHFVIKTRLSFLQNFQLEVARMDYIILNAISLRGQNLLQQGVWSLMARMQNVKNVHLLSLMLPCLQLPPSWDQIKSSNYDSDLESKQQKSQIFSWHSWLGTWNNEATPNNVTLCPNWNHASKKRMNLTKVYYLSL